MIAVLRGYNTAMRRLVFIILVLALLLVGCGVLTLEKAPPRLPAQGPPAFPSLPAATAFPAVTPALDLVITPPAAGPPEIGVTVTGVPDLIRNQFELPVKLHPDGPLFVGDQVSLEVIAGGYEEAAAMDVQVSFPGESEIMSVEFGHHGIAGRRQATFLWAWDTDELDPGDYTLSISLAPDGPAWEQMVTLLPADLAPYPEPEARWASAESDCCVVHYITGTEAERDLPELLAMVDRQADSAGQFLEAAMEEPVEVTFLPRVLGHGGFASDELSVSYLERNYAGGSSELVLHHELVHKLDSLLGGEHRPTMLVEGLAVYLTGGHFKPEPLMGRAAALLPPADDCIPAQAARDEENRLAEMPVCGLDLYLPFEDLLKDFYFTQHEIGYLEAAALVEYMVDTWGWEAYEAFYRDMHPIDEGERDEAAWSSTNWQIMENALLEHFGLTVAELEEQYLAALSDEQVTPQLVNDVRLTVEYYNTVRRYQLLLDPSAYFLTAWLTDGGEMRERGIVADFLRRPSTQENLALETMLASAGESLHSADYEHTERVLSVVNAILDVFTDQAPDPFQAHPLAADHFSIVGHLLAEGYQPQKIHVEGNLARVWATKNAPDLMQISMARSERGWEILLEVQ